MSIFSKILKFHRNKILFIIIAVFTILAYYPSFSSYFYDGDTHKYFLETQRCNLWELITKFNSYSLSTKYAQGDTLSFRPLPSILSGLQRYFFGTKYILWQGFNIILHLIVVLSLYRLLIRIDNSFYAWFLSFLFSVGFIFVGALTRSNINSYFIFLVLVLTALYYLYDCASYEINRKKMLWIFLCMFFACFIYETGVIFCLFFVFYLWIINRNKSEHKRDHNYLMLFIPIVMYLFSYFIDKYSKRDWVMEFEVRKIFNMQVVYETIIAIPRIFLEWIKRILPFNYKLQKFAPSFLILNLWQVALILIAYLCFGFLTSWEWIKKNRFFLVLISAMMVSNLALICFGRIGTHGVSYLLNAEHPMYMFWIYFIIFLYLIVDFKKLKENHKRIWYFGLFSLSFLIVFNISATYIRNNIMRTRLLPTRLYMEQIYNFIKNHHKEADFSFNVVSPPLFAETVTMTEGYADPKGKIVKKGIEKDFSLPEIFFGEYYKKNNPKYILEYDIEENKIKIRNE